MKNSNAQQGRTKLYCAAMITALITLLSVFLANVGHTEYKSQMRKRKSRKECKSKILHKAVQMLPEAKLVTNEEYIPAIVNKKKSNRDFEGRKCMRQ